MAVPITLSAVRPGLLVLVFELLVFITFFPFQVGNNGFSFSATVGLLVIVSSAAVAGSKVRRFHLCWVSSVFNWVQHSTGLLLVEATCNTWVLCY
jgi:hypothetical protein